MPSIFLAIVPLLTITLGGSVGLARGFECSADERISDAQCTLAELGAPCDYLGARGACVRHAVKNKEFPTLIETERNAGRVPCICVPSKP